MEAISVFDIFKIGVGPSSSHTLGPWNAALKFVDQLNRYGIDKIQVHLYGSLSKTGVGHATDKAVLLGLLGYRPETVETDKIDSIIDEVRSSKYILINSKSTQFDFKRDIVFEQSEHSLHPNTLIFNAYMGGELVLEQIFASVGGGFIEGESPHEESTKSIVFPYPINSGADLLRYTNANSCSISEIVYKNELTLRSAKEIDDQMERIFDVMLDSIYTGCITDGILPGGLNVSRRAKGICDKLISGARFSTRSEWWELLQLVSKDFNSVNKWVSCFALAVNEQNASMGRIVTSPTNGAAGVIPAVLLYYLLFFDAQKENDIRKFIFTAGEIGCLFKKGATISAAVGGCQAEIGVSSAMAAGGLTEVLGGTPEQCLMAAEIAMEHQLGLTCDPIRGLVQVPCIERNAMGAIKAITAANLALESDSNRAIVHLDAVIKTMWEVANNMHSKYKETSEGGLAINLPVVNPEC